MAPVRKARAAFVNTASHRHRQSDRSKAGYKVVFEEFALKKKLKTYLTFDTIPPRGYTFIPAGDPQLTKRCKRVSKELDMTVYIVSTGKSNQQVLSLEVRRIGYHFSTFAVEKACQILKVTLNAAGRVVQSHFANLNHDFNNAMERRQTRAKRPRPRLQREPAGLDYSLDQAMIDSQAREAIKDLFPRIPERDLHEVIIRAFDKEAGLIGTAEGYSLARRANLAVGAHIRHVYTNYDELLKTGIAWHDARRGVEQFTLDKLVSWRGEDDDDDDPIIEEVLREVVVISDDEGELDEQEHSTVARKGRAVCDVPSEEMERSAIDLTISDDEDESDEEEAARLYQGAPQAEGERTYEAAREARGNKQRQARWEQALSRQKQNPMPANTRDLPQQARPETASTSSIPVLEKAAVKIPGLDGHNRFILGSQTVAELTSFSCEKPTTSQSKPLGYSHDPKGWTAGPPAQASLARPNNHSNSQAHVSETDHNRMMLRKYATGPEISPDKSVGPVVDGHQPSKKFVEQNILPSVEPDYHHQKVPQSSRENPIDNATGNRQRTSFINLDREKGPVGEADSLYLPSRGRVQTYLPGTRPGTILVPLDGGDEGNPNATTPIWSLHSQSNTNTRYTAYFQVGGARASRSDRLIEFEPELSGSGGSKYAEPTVSNHPPALSHKPGLVRLSDEYDPCQTMQQLHDTSQYRSRPVDRTDAISSGASKVQPQIAQSRLYPMQRPPRLIRLGPSTGSQTSSAEKRSSSYHEQCNTKWISPKQVMLPFMNPFGRDSFEESKPYTRPPQQHQVVPGQIGHVYEPLSIMTNGAGNSPANISTGGPREVIVLDD